MEEIGPGVSGTVAGMLDSNSDSGFSSLTQPEKVKEPSQGGNISGQSHLCSSLFIF